MQTYLKSSKTNLEFTKVKTRRYVSYGVLKNSKGDKFKLTISGTNKEQVQKFIDYQKKQAQKNEGIKITIGSRQKRKALASQLKTPEKAVESKQDKEYTQAKWQGISINLSPDINAKNISNKPFVLHYEIDPPIMEAKVHDYTFQNNGMVTLECSVVDGRVKIQLFEFTDDLHTASNQKLSTNNEPAPIVSKTSPGKFQVAHDSGTHGNGFWNFRVTGVENARYKISIDLVWDVTKNFNEPQALLGGVALH
jgi:hypothetical protein